MKLLALSLCLAAFAAAQPATTHIHDVIYDQSGNVYAGNVQISLSSPGVTSSALPIVRVVKNVVIPPTGVLDVSLIGNDTATPVGTSYTFAFGSGDRRTCTIPTTGSTITLANYCTETNPGTPLPSIPAAWLNVSTLPAGNYCLQVPGGGLPPTWGICSGGGGPTDGMTWNAGLMTWNGVTMTWH